jgi:hypothetical protein
VEEEIKPEEVVIKEQKTARKPRLKKPKKVEIETKENAKRDKKDPLLRYRRLSKKRKLNPRYWNERKK